MLTVPTYLSHFVFSDFIPNGVPVNDRFYGHWHEDHRLGEKIQTIYLKQFIRFFNGKWIGSLKVSLGVKINIILPTL